MPTKGSQRFKHIKRRYGISEEEYKRILESQYGKCAICGLIAQNIRGFHIDHNHIEKRIRGILCGNCNIGLGQFKDSIESLEKAIEYLKTK